MIEQGSAWAILGLTDKRQKSGRSAFGGWLHEKDSTADGKIRFTSDSKEHLYWEWKSESPATMQVLITLTGTRRSSDGSSSAAAAQVPVAERAS